MRFKFRSQGPGIRGQGKTNVRLTLLFLTFLAASFFGMTSHAELLDRIVAVVNSDVILYSELQDAVEHSKAEGEKKSEIEILHDLIDRTLLLERARKFSADMDTYALDKDEARTMIDDYINRRIRAFIHVPFESIENYYESHKDDFGGRDIYGAWDAIESRLKVDLLRKKIEEHMVLLRKEAYIRIQLGNE